MYNTSDGVEITPGLRVFTNDWVWGAVCPRQFETGSVLDPGGQYFDGWFKVELESGEVRLYDGGRLSTYKP